MRTKPVVIGAVIIACLGILWVYPTTVIAAATSFPPTSDATYGALALWSLRGSGVHVHGVPRVLLIAQPNTLPADVPLWGKPYTPKPPPGFKGKIVAVHQAPSLREDVTVVLAGDFDIGGMPLLLKAGATNTRQPYVAVSIQPGTYRIAGVSWLSNGKYLHDSLPVPALGHRP